jgi:sulfonate transport system substrate-binding protein
MTFMKTSFSLSLFGAAMLTLAGCNNASQTANDAGNTSTANTATTNTTTDTAANDTPTEVVIGYNPTIVQPQPLLGVTENEYSKRMPDVKFSGKEYKAGPDVIEALRAGVVQIGSSGAYPAMKAYAGDGDIVMLSGAASGGTEISVLQSSTLKSVKDLRGKKIAVNQAGSTVDAMVRINLLKAGLRPDKDVQIVEVEPSEQAEALKNGDVEAVAAPAPWPSDVQIKAKARPLLDWKAIYNNGNYLAGSIFTTKKFADAHPAFIQKFIAANRALTDELNQDRTKSDARVLAAWSKVSKKTLAPDVAKKAFATIRYTTEAKEAGMQSFADQSYKVGIARKKMDLKGFVVQSQ